jgi:hypothetical protein
MGRIYVYLIEEEKNSDTANSLMQLSKTDLDQINNKHKNLIESFKITKITSQKP